MSCDFFSEALYRWHGTYAFFCFFHFANDMGVCVFWVCPTTPMSSAGTIIALHYNNECYHNYNYLYNYTNYTAAHYSILQVQIQQQLQPHYITQHYTTVITLHYTSTTTAAVTATTTTTRLHYTTLHILHYATLQYTTLHYTYYTNLHYATLHHTSLHWLHCTTLQLQLHYTNYTALHYNNNYNYTTLCYK